MNGYVPGRQRVRKPSVRASHFTRVGALLLGVTAACGCSRADTKSERQTPLTSASAPLDSAAPKAPAPAPPAPDRNEPPETASGDAGAGEALIVDEIVDLGPAGPATATTRGVALVTRTDEVELLPLQRSLRQLGGKPVSSPIAPTSRAATDFVSLGRAPAALGDSIAWISRGKLLKRGLARGSELQVLASDARDGTRVAAPVGGGERQQALAYVARAPGGDLIAKLWTSQGGIRVLSPAGSAANSVALVQRANDLVAVYLEGRTGMTPLHARRIRGAELDADAVVWVGGTAQPMTETAAAPSPTGDVWAFIPIERDASSFGLARVHITRDINAGADVNWRMYPNGMDPAPAATGVVCEKPAILYTRPSEAAPRSPKELHLASLEATGLGASILVASARVFSDVSLAAVDGGALIVYVADRRTWARTLRCPKS